MKPRPHTPTHEHAQSGPRANFAQVCSESSPFTIGVPSDHDTSIQAAMRLLLTQLELNGVRHLVISTRQHEAGVTCIGIHPEDLSDLKDICQSLGQIKLIRSAGPDGAAQIIFENPRSGARRHPVITVIPLRGDEITSREACDSPGISSPGGKTTTDDLPGKSQFEMRDRAFPNRKAANQSSWRLALRHLEAWIRPAGLFCVFLGPDGVGKSTTIRRLQSELQALSIPCGAERWRPGVIRKVAGDSSNRMPHAKSLRGAFTSALCVVGLAFDFSIGYAISTYPAMTRSEAIIFDRYFHDLLVDPKRYRYAGPMWLPRLIGRFIPPRNALFIILDADEEIILGRKQELPPDELRRQRKAYRAFSSHAPNSMIVSASKPVDEMVAEIVDRILDILASRDAAHARRRKGTDLNSVTQSTSPTHPTG
jgi:thymidylate kinase